MKHDVWMPGWVALFIFMASAPLIISCGGGGGAPVTYLLTVVRAGNGQGNITSSPPGIQCPGNCSRAFAQGTQVTLTATPDINSSFDGWTGACSSTNFIVVVTMDSAKTCTATFNLLQPATANLTVSKNGNGVVTSTPSGISCGMGCASQTASFTASSTVLLFAYPDPGWRFAGWGGDCSGNATNVQIIMDANKTCTATFVQQFTLTVTKNGNGVVTSTPAGIDCGNTCSAGYDDATSVTLIATEDPGWRFDSWSGCDATNGNQCMVTMNASRTVTARFVQQVSLSVSKNGNGTVRSDEVPPRIDCGGVCSADYDVGSRVTLTATEDPGWRFDSWSGCDAASGNQCTVTIGSARLVIANFVQQFGLSVFRTEGGGVVSGEVPPKIDCGTVCSADYDAGATVTLTANPQAGWRFDAWSGCDATNGNQCTLTMSGARTVTATFVQQFSLTVTKNGNGAVTSTPAGIDCGGVCSSVFDAGTVVTLVATPDAGWRFDSWSGDPDCGDGTVTMDGNKTCTATFVQQFTLTVTKNGNGVVTSTPAGINCGGVCSSVFDAGTVVTLVATPDAGWSFSSWSGACTGTDPTTQVTMDASKTCTAAFTAPPPAGARLFVSDATGKLLAFDNPYTANGDVAPLQNISGVNTQLSNPRGIYYDAGANRMYVANFGGNSILVFDNFTALNGNVAPNRVISGPGTGLNGPYRLALDTANDRLYVADYSGNSVVVFNNASSANGNVTPARTISGAATLLEGPTGISVDTTRNLLIVTCDAAAGGRTLFWDNASTVNGNVPPNRKIEGSNANYNVPVDHYYATTANHLYIGNFFGSFDSDVTVFHNASTANGNIAPDRTIDTNPFAFALGVFVDVNQNMLFLGMSSGQVGVYDNASSLNGTVNASRLIAGSNTQLGLPFGIFVSPIP
ncbi:MAG: InlB B-repeat-containing protein [bacterium JZ-2024 1]